MAIETAEIPHPPIASEDQWLEERKKLLAQEKELTRLKDRVNAARRRLPMVKVTKHYTFEGPEGKVTLLDLFQGKRQLIVHHFMFGPDWEAGCPGCTGHVNAIGDLSSLGERDTRYVIVSRAPLEKLEAYKKLKGWEYPWYSSGNSDFNFDYNVSFQNGVKDAIYNYAPRGREDDGEGPGMSVFFRIGDEVYHTYSVYARGLEAITDSYDFLDLTPYGRQEDFEDSPEGWPQKPTYGA
jgi:predicted dithiol-disulfide oxidoreductase (DUF899 family)